MPSTLRHGPARGANARTARAASPRGSCTPRRSGGRARAAAAAGSRRRRTAGRFRTRAARPASGSGAYGRIAAPEPEAAAQHDAAVRAQEHMDHLRVLHPAPVVAGEAAHDRRHAGPVERARGEAERLGAHERRSGRAPFRSRCPRPDDGPCPSRASRPARRRLDGVALVCERVPDPVAHRIARDASRTTSRPSRRSRSASGCASRRIRSHRAAGTNRTRRQLRRVEQHVDVVRRLSLTGIDRPSLDRLERQPGPAGVSGRER